MIPKQKSNRYLVITLALLIVATQIMFFGTTSSAENESRENEKHTVQSYWETTAYVKYSKDNINILAEKYSVEPAYLNYLVEVEREFDLEPYELMALIAQESEFRSITHMDGGSLSYNTTQMKLPTALTSYVAITEYYNKNIAYPTHELLTEDRYYAALLAGGYLRYLHDVYEDKYESYTAYKMGINGRMSFFNRNGHFQSPYALRVVELTGTFSQEGISLLERTLTGKT